MVAYGGFSPAYSQITGRIPGGMGMMASGFVRPGFDPTQPGGGPYNPSSGGIKIPGGTIPLPGNMDPNWVNFGGWTPGEFNRPATPYPVSPYAGSTGGSRRAMSGGGGGGYGIATGHSFNPTATMGPGAYWPGGNAEFNRQQQLAIMGIMGGNVAPDTRQPAQVLASMMRGSLGGGGNPLARGMMGGGSAYGRGGSGGGAGDFQSAYDAARMENEARYRDILQGKQAGRDMLAGMGAQEAADINEAYAAQEAARRQSLVGRGLGSSTIVDTMQMGNERERIGAQNRLNEILRREQYGALQDQLGFMERREDEYPDFTQLERLAQGVGAAGGGGAQTGGYQLAVTPTMGAVGYQMPTAGAYGSTRFPSAASAQRYYANRDYWRNYNQNKAMDAEKERAFWGAFGGDGFGAFGI